MRKPLILRNTFKLTKTLKSEECRLNCEYCRDGKHGMCYMKFNPDTMCHPEKPSPVKGIEEEIGQILASDCRTPKGCLLDHQGAIDALKALFSSVMLEIIGQTENEYPKNVHIRDKRIFGRNQLRTEIRQRVKERI